MKRKIIEVYVEENEDEQTFTIEKVEDSEVANETIKALAVIFYKLKSREESLELTYDEEDLNE